MALPIIGDIINAVINKGGDLVSEFIQDKDKGAEFRHKLELAVLADKGLERDVEARLFEAQQVTIQAELAQSDIYTKRTRPVIARRSFYAGMAYVVLSTIPEAGIVVPIFGWSIMPWSFNWEILMLMYAPCLSYIGVRGFEKWKAGGA